MRSIRILAAVLFILGAFIAGCGSSGGGDDFCSSNCSGVVAAGCTNGPTSIADCVEGCHYAESTCPVQFNALADCADGSTTYECDAFDAPSPVGCGTESEALSACLNAG